MSDIDITLSGHSLAPGHHGGPPRGPTAGQPAPVYRVQDPFGRRIQDWIFLHLLHHGLRGRNVPRDDVAHEPAHAIVPRPDGNIPTLGRF